MGSEIAKDLADYLFTSGAGEQADRLVLVKDNDEGLKRNLGGWNKRAVIDKVDAALAAERELQWQPMETAPKDGTEVLLHVERRAGTRDGMLVGHYMPGGYCIEDHPAIDEGWYFWSGSMFDKASKPIRWMPLPAPPAAAIRREVKNGK